MFELLATIVLLSILGACFVPVMTLTMARFGLFEPIEFELFGRTWRFAPRTPK